MRQHSVGAKIAELREKRHLTQAQLAEELHFTHQTISNWERGVSMPDLETAAKLAEFFGVSADELLFGKVKTAPAPTPAPPKLYRRTESEPVPAANALKILLRVFAGFAVAEIVLSFLSLVFPSFALFVGLIPVFVVSAGLAGVYFAALILFFFAKEYSRNRKAKPCFFIGIAVYAAVLIAAALHALLQPDSAADGDAAKFSVFYGFIALAGLAAVYFSAPYFFQENECEYAARKKYFYAAAGVLVCTALSAFFSSVEEAAAILDWVVLALSAYGMFLLNSCTENRTRLVCRTSTRPPQAAWFKDLPDGGAETLPVVNAEALSVAAAERAQAARALGAKETAPAPTYTKTVIAEEERIPQKVLWIAFGAYAFFVYVFPLIVGPFRSDAAVVLLAIAICLPHLALSVLFVLSKESAFCPLSFALVGAAVFGAAASFLCFCAQIFFPREPTELFPYALLAVPILLNFLTVFGAALCFRGGAESKKTNLALSLLFAALSAGILVLFLVFAFDPNSDPAVLLLDFWANGAVFALLIAVKKQKTKRFETTIVRKRV